MISSDLYDRLDAILRRQSSSKSPLLKTDYLVSYKSKVWVYQLESFSKVIIKSECPILWLIISSLDGIIATDQGGRKNLDLYAPLTQLCFSDDS